MEKLTARYFIFPLLLLISQVSFSQFNYIAANATVVTGGAYTDLAATGTAVTTNFNGGVITYSEDNSSIQNIGFNFIYNKTTFTQFVINTNGFIKLGNTAPQLYIRNILNSSDTNIIAPFNCDLRSGTNPPEYRVFTSGVAPNRICTIQFKNLKVDDFPYQFDNINFQVKLYETSNRIEFVYGTFGTTAANLNFTDAVVGIKGSSAFRSVNATKALATAWASATFINGNYTSTQFVIDKTSIPASGLLYRFTAAPLVDGEVTDVYTLGNIPTTYGVPHIISARITNPGATTLTNLSVSLSVTGANNFSNNKQVTVAAQATTVVNFDAFSPAVAGTNIVTVSIPSDNINANNSKTFQQVVNANTFSYQDSSDPSGSYGFGTGAGLILTKYNMTGTATVSAVIVHLNPAANAGNTVYAVVMNSAGTIVGQSSNYITNAEDLDQYKVFYITSPPSITNNSFYVGLAQTANAVTGYSPVSTQTESSPTRPGAFYIKSGLTSGVPTETTISGRFMIKAVLNNASVPSNLYTNTYWTWMHGDNLPNKYGIYGSKGVAAAANIPGAREGSVSWTDTSGNLWLMGGSGNAKSDYGWLNDLWKLNISTNQWTWINGDSIPEVYGIYGSMGSPSASNKPGGRDYPITWADSLNNLWLFGGYGNANSNSGKLNDLWKYNIASNQWTWVKGDSIPDVYSVYGTKGASAAANKPGSRGQLLSWKDRSGYLWLFGGDGLGNSNHGSLNDLWKYNPTINEWTWIKGDSTVDIFGVYGSLGVAAPANNPGGRHSAMNWTDTSGNFWLFGGDGFANSGGQFGSNGQINDLWKYNIATNQWTWIKGDSSRYGDAVYGTKGFAADANKPGSRIHGATWTDKSGNLWLFGGLYPVWESDYNDLWKYVPSTNQWTWVKGSKTGAGGAGVYGTLGVEAAGNTPGGRYGAVSWIDGAGDLWLFGGKSYQMSSDIYNDLWRIYGGTRYIFNGNGDWTIASNWVNNLVAPTNIPGGVQVVIDNILAGQCDATGNLNIQVAGRLSIQPLKKINIINGNLSNSGLLNGYGTVIFTGGLSDLSSSGYITAPIILNNKQINLVGITNVRSVQLLTGSHINLKNYDLKMDTATLVSNSTNYIVSDGTGRLERKVSGSPVLFPIGISSSSYTPATVTNTGTADQFAVRVVQGVTTEGLPNMPVSTETPVLTENVDRTWFIREEASGSSNGTITLQWNLGDEQNGFQRGNSYISHLAVCPPPDNCNISFWDADAATPAGGANPYTQTRTNVTNFNTPNFVVTSRTVVYTFINASGNKEWSNPLNWINEMVPPNTVIDGMEVIIAPITGNECIFRGALNVINGGKVTVMPGNILTIRPN